MSEISRVAVALQWSGPPGQDVELMGDFPDWRHPVAMTEVSPGRYECHLKLEPGLYRYKFRVNEEKWVVDPNALLLDRAEGYKNGVLVVGGVIHPVYFAPDRQHCAQWEDGRLVVHAERRAGSALPCYLCLTTAEDSAPPGQERTKIPMLPVMTRGDRQILRAEIRRLPTSVPWTHMHFAQAPTHHFLLPPPRTPLGQPPAWLKGAVLYAIFLDRWHRSAHSPDDVRLQPRDAPSTADTFYGGDLDGITESLDYLAGLGITGIVLTPIHCSPTPHRYDSTDLMAVDPMLGGEAAFHRLLETAHQRNLKVIVDVSVTHINEQHPAFQDVLERQERSSYLDWFYIKDFPVVARDASTFAHYPTRPELPWLNLGSGEAREHALQAVEQLVEWGVDGLRLDAVEEAPDDFWQELRSRVRQRNPELLLLGEVISDKPGRLSEHRGVDTVTDFQHREAMLDFFARGHIDAREFWDRQTFYQFRMGPFDPSFRLLFLDNHDTSRFLSVAILYNRLRLALSYLMFRPEPVWITYGTEFGLSGGIPEFKLDDAWPERLPTPPLDATSTQTQLLFRQLTHLRRSLEPMHSPILRMIRADGQLLVLERVSARTHLRGYFYAGDADITLSDIPPEAHQVLTVNTSDASSLVLTPHSARWFLIPVQSP